MASRRRQIEDVMAETKDPIVRMQLTGLLNEELQRQNGIIRRAADALDSMLREAVGRLGNRSTEKPGHDKIKTRKTSKNKTLKDKTLKDKTLKDKTLKDKTLKNKTLKNKTLKTQMTRNSRKKAAIDTQTLPDDLAEIVAAWPKLPEHVKAAMCDILRVT